jgi:Tfp pilus assembly protein FimV
MTKAQKQNQAPKTPNYNRRRVVAGSLATLVGAAAFVGGNKLADKVSGLDEAAQASPELIQPLKREYVAQSADTVWSIASRAFPEDNSSEHASAFYDDRQAIEGQLDDEVLNPGDVIELPGNAQIGTPIYANQSRFTDQHGNKYVIDPSGSSHRLDSK